MRQYADAGWDVLACCRSPSDELEHVAARNEHVTVHALDVANHARIEELGAELADASIDVLLNNAGMYGRVGFAEGGVEHQAFGNTDYADWERVLRVNLMGPMKMAETFVEQVARSKTKEDRNAVQHAGFHGAE